MTDKPRLRSRAWFDNPDEPDLTALYIERYLNWGLSLEELQSGKPIIGIAQTGSDLSPCNRHHIVLAQRVRDGIIAAGGIPIEFPVHPIQESGKRPTAALDRNLTYLSLVEVLHGYPLDGVVLMIGCDKTTPACVMGAATVNIPAIALSVGPMLNGSHQGRRTGSGTIIWKAREQFARGEIDYQGFIRLVASSAPSVGYCNTMGTATTMNALAEVMGMQLPGSAAIPAPHRDRGEMAWKTGRRIVGMVTENLRPSDILTRAAFDNAIIATSAMGGSTNAAVHLMAIARHAGVDLQLGDFERLGRDVPLLVNMQPAGDYLGVDFHEAGGVPAVLGELAAAGHLDLTAPTATGRSLGEEIGDARSANHDVIAPFDEPFAPEGGFRVLQGNFFASAIFKTSVVTEAFRTRYLADPADPEAFEGTIEVFDGPEDYRARIDDPSLGLTERSILVMRGAGPVGYPGGAEVVNMRPPDYLLAAGIEHLPCIGDGRQSGTSGSPSILHVSPEAAVGGGIALLRSGDRLRVDFPAGRLDVLLDEAELARRREALEAAGGYVIPADQTPWQRLMRREVGQLEDGATLASAGDFQRIADTIPVPRDSH